MVIIIIIIIKKKKRTVLVVRVYSTPSKQKVDMVRKFFRLIPNSILRKTLINHLKRTGRAVTSRSANSTHYSTKSILHGY